MAHDKTPVNELINTFDTAVTTRVTDDAEYVSNCMAPKEYLASPWSNPIVMYHTVDTTAFRNRSKIPKRTRLAVTQPTTIHGAMMSQSTICGPVETDVNALLKTRHLYTNRGDWS